MKDGTFQQMLHSIQDSLVKDNLVEEVKELNTKLTDSIKQRTPLQEMGKSSPLSLPVCHMIIT